MTNKVAFNYENRCSLLKVEKHLAAFELLNLWNLYDCSDERIIRLKTFSVIPNMKNLDIEKILFKEALNEVGLIK